MRPDRPAAWRDLLRQFLGGQIADNPVAVATVADLRALSSREVAAYQVISVSAGNPGAGNHWCYTFTPSNASKALVLRICFAAANLETATTLIGVRIGAATAKAATNAVFPLGDGNAAMLGVWTVDEIANANVPLTLFNLFPSEDLRHAFEFPYPEYGLELLMQQGQVAEFVALTQDDAFSFRAGYYTQPIV